MHFFLCLNYLAVFLTILLYLQGESGDDKNSRGPSKRKKIRKLISDKKLTDSTKAAAKAEEERRRRVNERQKKVSSFSPSNLIFSI